VLLDSDRSQREEAMPHRPPSSSGLGHHPFKVAARVRIPLGVQSESVYISGPVVKSGVHAGLSSRRSRVQIPSGPQQGPLVAELRQVVLLFWETSTSAEGSTNPYGRVAQLAERPPEKRKVPGSTPGTTTKKSDGSSGKPGPILFAVDAAHLLAAHLAGTSANG
jgi:hypothetical protein